MIFKGKTAEKLYNNVISKNPNQFIYFAAKINYAITLLTIQQGSYIEESIKYLRQGLDDMEEVELRMAVMSSLA